MTNADPETSIPTYRDLLYPTLRALGQLGGSGRKDEVNETAIALLGLTDDQLAVEYPPSGKAHGSKVLHRLAFARSSLKLAGALDNSQRGVWALKDHGRELLTLGDDAARAADSAMRKGLREKRLSRIAPVEETDDAELESEEVVPDTDDWKFQLLEVLYDLSPATFERLAARLLREVGFTRVQVIGGANDQGVDGIGLLEMQLLTFPVFFQCKRYRGQVGPGHVRDFRGAMAGRGDKGLFITTGTFTPASREEATRPGVSPIDLIDGDRLCELLHENGLGLSTRVVVDRNFFDSL